MLVNRSLPIILGCSLLVGLLGLRIADPPFLTELRGSVFDIYQRLYPRPYQPVPVRVVVVDDASLRRLGQWPWPRAELARLIDNLGSLGAAAIALDIFFAEPDRLSPATLINNWPALAEMGAKLEDLPDSDALLAAAIARNRVVGGFALTAQKNDATPQIKASFASVGEDPIQFVSSFPGALINLPIIEEVVTGNGSITLALVDDAMVRELPLLQALGTSLVPSLTLEALRVAQGVRTLVVRTQGEDQGQAGLSKIKVGALTVPSDRRGRFLLHYSDTIAERKVPAWRVLEPPSPSWESLRPLFQGHIVFVGTSATGLGDLLSTPLNPVEPAVMVHAQAVEQMLSGWFLERPQWGTLAEMTLLAGIGLLLIVFMPRIGMLWAALVGAALVALVAATSLFLFRDQRLLLDPGYPSLGALAMYLAASLTTYLKAERERRQVRQAFGQYVSPDLVHQLASDPNLLTLRGETRELTFLFSDIAGFTSLTESIAPEKLVELLNAYLDQSCTIVMKHGGTIDKIVGDAIHAMFNAPLDQSDHAERAVRCALEFNEFGTRFSAEQREQGIQFGVTRIGVNTGPAVVGNFGGAKRFDYTAHGDAINTAARLEAANKALGTTVCVSGTSVAGCQAMAFRPIGTLFLRGKTVGVEVFEPLPDGDNRLKYLGEYRDAFRQVADGDPEAAAWSFRALAERHPEDTLVRFHMERLHAGGASESIRVA